MAKRKTKKQTKKIEVKTQPTDFVKKQRRQLIWIFAIIVLIFVVVIGGYYFIKSLSRFSYVGVTWEKLDYQGIDLYHSRFPVVFDGKLQNNYNLYLRTDPRENNVSVDAIYAFYPNIVIANDENSGNCYNAGMANLVGAQFLGAIGFNVSGAYSNKSLANATGMQFANCSSAYGQTVLLIKKSENNASIGQSNDNPNCYILEVGECENLKVMEKLIISVVGKSTGHPI